MYRSMFAVLLGLLMSASCLAQESLVGTYKLVSVTRIIDGKFQESPGKLSHGYIIVTPTHYVVFYTDGERKYGTSDAERATLWDTMTAYAGPYRFDGKTVTVSVDTSWNEVYNGTQQVRDVELRGKRLISSSAPRPWGRDPAKQILLRTEWEKVE
jgi:hypothetical protein